MTSAINIFFAINNDYCQHLCVAIGSIIENNKKHKIQFNVMCNNLPICEKNIVKEYVESFEDKTIVFHEVDDTLFDNFVLNIKHISIATYYRYLIPFIDKESERALYLDADIVVKGDLDELWNTNIDDYYAAGVEDAYILDVGYKNKLGFDDNDLYINAGVILLNLNKMRNENVVCKLFDNTEKYKDIIEYQDQDIINITFKGMIKKVDNVYNYTFRDVVSNGVEKLSRAVVVHFTGDKKPWNYFYSTGNLAENYYYKYIKTTPYNKWYYRQCMKKPLNFVFSKNRIQNLRIVSFFGFKFVYDKKWFNGNIFDFKNKNDIGQKNNKIKIALLVDEFFGGMGTAYGGYGFLARNYIAKYLPNEEISVDLLLGFSKNLQHEKIDNIDVFKLPKDKRKAKKWLQAQGYDAFLSIELTSSSYEILKLNEEKKKLILWIQDPRPWYEWREINTVKLYPETCYWDTPVYEYVNFMNWKRKVKFITQGRFLIEKARDLYRLNNDLDIEYLPNPIDSDKQFNVQTFEKKNNIIFLGRIESVKRGWLFCEIAKEMPGYNFFVLGSTFREKGKNSEIINKYKNVENLHFVGHVEGEQKAQYLREAKILVNTSIHEALPISFLEALSFGTLIVSNRNPEQLTQKFGYWVGDVFGDGFDKVNLYVDAIKRILNDENLRQQTAEAAVKYVRDVHDTKKIIHNLREIIKDQVFNK